MADIPVYESLAETLVTVTANGQENLDFDFLVLRGEQVNVVYMPVGSPSVNLQFNIDYTVSGIGNPNGGTVHLTTPDAMVGDKFLIYRHTPIERLKDWQAEGDYKAALVNAEQDEIYMIMQELRRDGDVGSERQERIAADEELQNQIDNLVGGDYGSLARYAKTEKRRHLDVNLTLEAGGGWPSTAPQEFTRAYSGGNPDRALPNLAANDLGTVMMIPPSEESTNFVAPNTPWLNYAGAMRRLMPVDIMATLYNSPVAIPPFEPVLTNGSGVLSFRYTGDYPLHTIMEGTLEVLIQTSVLSADASTRHVLRLIADPATVPLLERGESSGGRNLAAAVGALRTSTKLQDYREFNDPCGPVTPEVLADVATAPELYVGSDHGYFNLGDTTEELRTEDALGPVGPEVRTTKWMDCSGFDKSDRCIVINFTGISTRGRVQYKTSDGVIHNFAGQTRDVSARRVYRLPHDAVEFRVYHTGRGATVNEASVSVKALSMFLSRNHDPLKGYFDRRSFSVCRDVTFWPGGVYAFDILTLVADGGSARDTGFRYTGGGLKFMFDAGRMRKRMSSRLYEGV